MIVANDVITRASKVLADQTQVRWTQTEMIDWCKDAVRQIVLARPDAYSITRNFTLKAGSTLQTVGNVASDDNKVVSAMTNGPSLRLLRVTRNIGPVGTGRPIREASRVALDSEMPDWHLPVPAGSWGGVQHYTFDNVSPYTFYVYPCPPSTATTQVIEIIHSALPDFSQSSGSISLGVPDQYISPLVDWVLYRAFSKDAEYAGNMERATHHLNAFATALQLTQQAGFIASTPVAATPLPAGAGWKRTGG